MALTKQMLVNIFRYSDDSTIYKFILEYNGKMNKLFKRMFTEFLYTHNLLFIEMQPELVAKIIFIIKKLHIKASPIPNIEDLFHNTGIQIHKTANCCNSLYIKNKYIYKVTADTITLISNDLSKLLKYYKKQLKSMIPDYYRQYLDIKDILPFVAIFIPRSVILENNTI